jgi:hypothetical protein
LNGKSDKGGGAQRPQPFLSLFFALRCVHHSVTKIIEFMAGDGHGFNKYWERPSTAPNIY